MLWAWSSFIGGLDERNQGNMEVQHVARAPVEFELPDGLEEG
jgi:hypothetical protein